MSRSVRARRGVVLLAVCAALAIPTPAAFAAAPDKKKPKSTTTAKTGTASVDLTVNGAAPVVLKGTKVMCQVGAGSTVYVDGADYPSLGSGNFLQFSLSGSSPPPRLLKAVVGNVGYLSENAPASSLVMTGKTMTANGITGQSGTGTITVTGKVVCP